MDWENDWILLNNVVAIIFRPFFFSSLTNRVFTLYDADGDGVISRSELRDVVMAIHRLSPHGKINDKDSIRIAGGEKDKAGDKSPRIVSPQNVKR